MLHYCSSGTRNYHLRPVKTHLRHYWEFQFFIGGRSCPSFPGSGRFPENENNFWILRPDCAHGWHETENKACDVAVFHFSEVPETLGRLFNSNAALAVTLPQKLLDEAHDLARHHGSEVLNPDALSPVRYRLCLDRLSLIFLEEMNRQREISNPSREKMICDAAIAWMCSHMEEGPKIQELAEKMGYNISHLRRIFQEITGESPHKELTIRRMIRAAELLKSGTNTVIDISMACGYHSHSAFTRAFKGYYGVSPSEFRKQEKTLA
ncbi:AraC family transcriptional regulator [Oceanispirochaeta sp.]|jgi:AraC-like DNA-binding protein|uniref:helix-turn-helix transcriptional regulator n=1 Tax=Oceanispirochaeta sp. TaxID=2035350 RepID=UPI00260275F1|nr:AraC family transcriptional regulator [Oceanispirochaeta sp.]MDA3956783.1 AraC family transcriptional regulator [Oceanispirochaeta sp.]